MTESDQQYENIMNAAFRAWQTTEIRNALRGTHAKQGALETLYVQCVMNEAGYRYPDDDDILRFAPLLNGGIAPFSFDGSIAGFAKINPKNLLMLRVGPKTVKRWYEILGLPSWTGDLTETANAEEQAVLTMAEAMKDLASAYAAALQPLVASISELANTLAELRIEMRSLRS